jgi:acetyl-CoA acetyltransferase family protein
VIPHGKQAGSDDWVDTTIGWRFSNPWFEKQGLNWSMAEIAAKIAKDYGISRLAQDQFTLRSHQRTTEAWENKLFQEELIPVQTNEGLFEQDECIRPNLTLEQLSRLKPLSLEKLPNPEARTITAANASGIQDGATALLLVSEKTLETSNRLPLARISAFETVGLNPLEMGLGAARAAETLLKKTGNALADLALIDIQESFAATVLACCERLSLLPEDVNQQGGALAIGSPLGAESARIVTTLAHRMSRLNSQDRSLAAVSVGLGQGMAILLEKP